MLRCAHVLVTSKTLLMLRCAHVLVTSETLLMLRCAHVLVTSKTILMLRRAHVSLFTSFAAKDARLMLWPTLKGLPVSRRNARHSSAVRSGVHDFGQSRRSGDDATEELISKSTVEPRWEPERVAPRDRQLGRKSPAQAGTTFK
eukprot:s4525_g2.t1